jgi:hypothetical protein
MYILDIAGKKITSVIMFEAIVGIGLMPISVILNPLLAIDTLGENDEQYK